MTFRKFRGGWEVLLIRRKNPPYQGCWAVPGGFLDKNEDAKTAAIRELREETSLRVTRVTEFGTFSDPSRDPRGRVLTVAFLTTISARKKAVASDDARELAWFSVDKLPSLAFDHDDMLRLAKKCFREIRRRRSSK